MVIQDVIFADHVLLWKWPVLLENQKVIDARGEVFVIPRAVDNLNWTNERLEDNQLQDPLH